MFQQVHGLEDQFTIPVPLDVNINIPHFHELLNELAQGTGRPHAFGVQSGVPVKRFVADVIRLPKLLIPVQSPGLLERLPELPFIFLDTGLGKEVLAVDGVFEPEEIEDRAEQFLAVKLTQYPQ